MDSYEKKMKVVMLLIILTLCAVIFAHESFGQMVDLSHYQQQYGEETLINFDISWTGETYAADSGYHLYYTPDAGLLEVIILTWEDDLEEPELESITEWDTTKFDYRINLSDVHQIFFRTTEGVTSVYFIRSEDLKEASLILNGKLVLHYKGQKQPKNFGGRKEDHYKNEIDWAYDPDWFEFVDVE